VLTITAILGGFLIFEFAWLVDPFELAGATFEPVRLRVFIAALIILSVSGVVLQRAWTGQLIFLSTAGFLITFYFVLYQAPDLALTQILVESATLVLVLLLLSRFARSAQRGQESVFSRKPRNLFNLGLSASLGTVITITILIANAHPPAARIGEDILLQTVPLAEGTNSVNTILVDFRGFDTMGEVAVLVIAVLGSIGLYFRYKRPESERQQRALGAPGFGIFHQHGPKKKGGRS
jgi:multisubunit Na+/H+ antiporter MnhB subunit